MYVNHPNEKALIHRANCRHYLFRKADHLPTGYWSPVFPERESAEEFARATHKRHVGAARCCL